ncbi:AAA family ATPase [Enterocloster citroniae]|uniref:AAA family ATPase n=1 Tax=Enterocloster citroniae TaxID=358743 RepID=UPI00349E7A5B
MGSFQEVVREKSKLRMALTGVSGAGKTLGALYIAFGLTGNWSKIAVIDTEHERARMYANRTDLGTGKFLYCPLYPPYTAERYTALVKEAAGVVGTDGVVIVDSFSHAWNNEGGILDVKDRIAAQQGKNSYTAWNEAGKVQNNLVNTILAVECHTIVTMRSKMDYVMQENERGKTQPVKVGLAPVQRDDTEYEFDIVLDIARSHIATASKDVTFLDKFGEVITPELGRQLKAWLDDGVDPAQLQGEKPITKEQWIALSKPYKELPEVLQAAHKAFGYQTPSEIRQKDIETIRAKAEEYAAAGGVPYA